MDLVSKTIEINGESKTIQPFSAFKAVLAGEIVARAGDQIPKLIEEYNQFKADWAEAHPRIVTRDDATDRLNRALTAIEEMDGVPETERGEFHDAALRQAHAIAASWQRTLDVGLADKEELRLPNEPSDEEAFLTMFKQVWGTARTELVQLLAIVTVTNADLERADENGGDEEVQKVIAAGGKRLLYDARLGELADVALAAYEIVVEEFSDRKETVGKLRTILRRGNPTPTDTDPDLRQTERKAGGVEPSSPSSDSSPEPSTGPDETSSTAPPGESSLSSVGS